MRRLTEHNGCPWCAASLTVIFHKEEGDEEQEIKCPECGNPLLVQYMKYFAVMATEDTDVRDNPANAAAGPGPEEDDRPRSAPLRGCRKGSTGRRAAATTKKPVRKKGGSNKGRAAKKKVS